MKRKLLHGFATLLSVGYLFLSCRKELSCENCQEKKPPIANAGANQTITLPKDSAKLDGTASTDADGSITTYKWEKIEGPAAFIISNAAAASTSVKSLTGGVYQFELTVRDNDGLSANDTMQVIVDDPRINQPPIADAGIDTTIALPNNTVTLDGSKSIDPDNNITAYSWSKISGPLAFSMVNASAVQCQVTGLGQALYQFELKVTDAGGLSAKDTVQVLVNNPVVNHPPVACAGADQTITLPVNAVTLNGSCSADPDNNITSYLWTAISGPASSNITNVSAVQTQATNLVEGVYFFELRVTDAGALFGRDTIKVTVLAVNPPANCTNCKIVFVSGRDGNSEIYSCNAEGSNITRLTSNTASDEQPSWSPDGLHIAFVSDRSGDQEIYIMNADGSNVVRKTFSAGYSENPTWSPDGTKVAYSTSSNGSANIWVVGAITGSPSLLFERQGFDGYPAWSPDGTKIAFVSDSQAFDIVTDIFTIKPDGTNSVALTGNIFDQIDYTGPSWSPNGNKIAVAISQRIGINQYNTQVGVMNSNGSALTAIISGADHFTKTSWSADGTKIAFTSNSGSSKDIKWVSADGSASGTIVTNGWNANWQH